MNYSSDEDDQPLVFTRKLKVDKPPSTKVLKGDTNHVQRGLGTGASSKFQNNLNVGSSSTNNINERKPGTSTSPSPKLQVDGEDSDDDKPLTSNLPNHKPVPLKAEIKSDDDEEDDDDSDEIQKAFLFPHSPKSNRRSLSPQIQNLNIENLEQTSKYEYHGGGVKNPKKENAESLNHYNTEFNDSTPSSEGQSSSHFTAHSKHRSKRDIAWRHISLSQDELGKNIFTCDYCKNVFRGGGIYRMKEHLAGAKGNIVSCLKVPRDVKFEMLNALKEVSKRRKNKVRDGVGIVDLDEDIEMETEDIAPPKNAAPKTSLGKRNSSSIFDNRNSFFQRGIQDPSQPSIKSTWHTKERIHDADLAIALWFYDAGIPMNAVNSPLFSIAMGKVACMGHGYNGPSYHAMRVSLLGDAKRSVKLIVDSYRKSWSETGCTIMSDGWRDCRQRLLINFLVYCPKGISFIKSVDASDVESNAENLCNLFAEIVEIVGSSNIVHFVTNNATNDKAAGRLLEERYPMICWSLCSVHCINLILKDISELDDVADLIHLASRVTVFIYNHKWPLNWLRKRDGWTEIIQPGATRFGTSFMALNSLHEHKLDLQALVTSNGFEKALKLAKAEEVKLIVLDENFWKNCLTVVKIMTPILRLLRICDSHENPSLGFVYEGMDRVIKDIKSVFKNKEDLYMCYTNIINSHWDNILRKSLHSAAYWLNPIFQYDEDNKDALRAAFPGVLDLFEKKTSEESITLVSQLCKFRDQVGDFGRPVAFIGRKSYHPNEWWKLFGCDVPELQRFAVRILSQTSSSSGCERNWSVFERFHAKRRNRLEHQRLSDLVYVHYNLRLQNRIKRDKRSYDPVDYESIDKTDIWVVDEHDEGELDYDELESMLDEKPPKYSDPSTTFGSGTQASKD